MPHLALMALRCPFSSITHHISFLGKRLFSLLHASITTQRQGTQTGGGGRGGGNQTGWNPPWSGHICLASRPQLFPASGEWGSPLLPPLGNSREHLKKSLPVPIVQTYLPSSPYSSLNLPLLQTHLFPFVFLNLVAYSFYLGVHAPSSTSLLWVYMDMN